MPCLGSRRISSLAWEFAFGARIDEEFLVMEFRRSVCVSFAELEDTDWLGLLVAGLANSAAGANLRQNCDLLL